jgi:acetolactate decarboxylase
MHASECRPSGYAIGVVCTRSGRKLGVASVNPPSPGTRLVDAAKARSEFTFADIDGTLVGLWSPGFSSGFSVQGYHFHFISSDRQHGGHLLDVEAAQLDVRIESLTDFHLALPASEAFLKADLSKNSAEELVRLAGSQLTTDAR